MQLAAAGHHTVLVSRTTEHLQALAEEIRSAGGHCDVEPCDVGDGDALAAMVDRVADTHERLDILVNNAGINRDGLLLRMSDEDFDEVIQVNLRSAFVTCRAAARPMMRNRYGRIINIASVTGIRGNPGQANYAAAKAGMIGMTKTIAREFAAKGILANVVAPGFIRTDMTDSLSDAILEEAKKQIPARRMGTPDDIAHLVAFLASEEAGYITGQVLVVDGGLTC